MFVPAAKLARPFRNVFPFLFLIFLFASCSTINYYQPNKPFVYQTNIDVQGDLSTTQKKELMARLPDQLYDSVQPKRVQRLIGWDRGPRLFYSVLTNPPVYDSTNADRSIGFMHALLNSMGYLRDSINYDTTLKIVQDKRGDQYRTTINFKVYPGKLFHIDSVSYVLPDTLNQLTKTAQSESFIKKGTAFSKESLTSEFNRLTDLYRNNGYLRFSFEELLAVWDTVGIGLLRPTLDPIEQARFFEAIRRRRENPTADVEVRLRSNEDSSHLIRYYVGDVVVYPDMMSDTSVFVADTTWVKGYKVVSFRHLYKPKIVAENIYLRRGDLYSQRNYLRTLNRFNAVGSWRLVSIDQFPRGATDTVDFVIRLTPARKYAFSTNVEGSQNFGSTILPNGNLIGLNLSLQNRNFARAANAATSIFRFATEINGGSFVQTKQIGFSHSIFFPRTIPKFHFFGPVFKENVKTSLGFNASYTSRKDFFDLTSITGAWGYEAAWRNKILTVRIPNVEYAYLRQGPQLKALILANQSYNYIFNSGLVTSVIGNFRVSGGKKNIANLAIFNVESSGMLTGLLHSKFIDSNLHRFLKGDAEFRQTYTIRRSAFAWRAFGGVGYEFPGSRFKYNRYLPFFKSYIAGGANSMRAWQLRKLGPGSTIKNFTSTVAPERFGDMQLEANAEYRFYITDFQGFKINSVLFTDMGNIWTLRYNPDFPDGQFKFQKLWKDLAIGVGTGLRVDLGFFLIRLDYAFKAKDPSPDEDNAASQNKWFYHWKPTGGTFQLGVTYPF